MADIQARAVDASYRGLTICSLSKSRPDVYWTATKVGPTVQTRHVFIVATYWRVWPPLASRRARLKLRRLPPRGVVEGSSRSWTHAAPVIFSVLNSPVTRVSFYVVRLQVRVELVYAFV